MNWYRHPFRLYEWLNVHRKDLVAMVKDISILKLVLKNI